MNLFSTTHVLLIQLIGETQKTSYNEKKRDHTKTKPVIGFKENYHKLGNIYENGNTQAIPTIL